MEELEEQLQVKLEVTQLLLTLEVVELRHLLVEVVAYGMVLQLTREAAS
jgi:hypothetical protein